jgi:hypothetical protein
MNREIRLLMSDNLEKVNAGAKSVVYQFEIS